MSYEQIQAVTQLIAGGLFLAVLIGVAVYVMRPSNKERFKRLSELPLKNDELDQKK